MKTINAYPRQAISTKYLPATNTRGSRIKASCDRGSVTVPYPHELSGADCHAVAVDALLRRFAAEDGNDKSWGTLANYAVGSTATGYVFVNVGDSNL